MFDFAKKIIEYEHIQEAIIIFLAIFAISRWEWKINQFLGAAIAGVALYLWLQRKKLPASPNSSSTPPYMKLKEPEHLYPLLCAFGLVIASHFFSFYLLFIVLVLLKLDRLGMGGEPVNVDIHKEHHH